MDPPAMRQHDHAGIYTDGVDLFTRVLVGTPTGGARTVTGDNGHRYRSFPPTGTKLAALVKRGVRTWPFREDSRVLYLGAGAGTTVSYVSDICPRGVVYAVEFAPEPFRPLMDMARARPNVVPILADARAPPAYAHQVGPPVDVLYQDVAQRDQWEIAHRNARLLLAPGGWVVLVLKASSVDVARPSARVFQEARSSLEAAGYRVEEMVDLEPFDREHAVLMARRT